MINFNSRMTYIPLLLVSMRIRRHYLCTAERQQYVCDPEARKVSFQNDRHTTQPYRMQTPHSHKTGHQIRWSYILIVSLPITSPVVERCVEQRWMASRFCVARARSKPGSVGKMRRLWD